MNYQTSLSDLNTLSPIILYQNDNFLELNEILNYQNLLKNNRWTMASSNSFEEINYISQDLYCHYQWDGNWDRARWLDHVSDEWELLYKKISKFLPRHYVHWIDVKITGPVQSGTPLHRDKEPWSPGGDPKKFKKAISIICNLNTEWDLQWGGGLILYDAKIENNKLVTTANCTVPLKPGQLLVMENCYHSIEPVVQTSKSRISFVLHVLEYQDNDSL
jgi:hypothetical protein